MRRTSAKPAAATAVAPTRRRSRRRSRGGSAYAPEPRLTSHPTHRAAYAETRTWLLEQHGPVCAYCGQRFTEEVMTLDHVAPRRGQTAYDRRDNLVLACRTCNAAKRDLAPTAFLLARRTRAAYLLRYGSHLSPMLVDLARSLAPADLVATLSTSTNGEGNGNGHAAYADGHAAYADGNGRHAADDDDSPYRD